MCFYGKNTPIFQSSYEKHGEPIKPGRFVKCLTQGAGIDIVENHGFLSMQLRSPQSFLETCLFPPKKKGIRPEYIWKASWLLERLDWISDTVDGKQSEIMHEVDLSSLPYFTKASYFWTLAECVQDIENWWIGSSSFLNCLWLFRVACGPNKLEGNVNPWSVFGDICTTLCKVSWNLQYIRILEGNA